MSVVAGFFFLKRKLKIVYSIGNNVKVLPRCTLPVQIMFDNNVHCICTKTI